MSGRPYLRYVKMATAVGAGCAAVAYGVVSTRRAVSAVVRTAVLDRERKSVPEYIYIDDVDYPRQPAEKKEQAGYFPPWKNLKRSLAWRLLWLCRHGSREQRNAAILQLAAIKKSKEWEYRKLAQALDMETAVLLARTEGADPRYFLPPPIHIRRAALASQYRAGRLRQALLELTQQSPHSCTNYFLSKYFANVQEQAMEADTIPSKPDSLSDRQLCLLALDAAHHHLGAAENDRAPSEAWAATRRRLIELVAELLCVYSGERDVELSALRILSSLSAHRELLPDLYQNGVLGPLTRWLRSPDVRLSCSAAGALANMAAEGPVYRDQHLFLLHPVYRSREPVKCDVLFVHGLRGGVFVTWRQRDPKSESLLGIFGKRPQKGRTTPQTDNGAVKVVTSDTGKSDRSDKKTGLVDRSDKNTGGGDRCDKYSGKGDRSDTRSEKIYRSDISGGKGDGANGCDHRQSERGHSQREETVLMTDENKCSNYSTLVGSADTGYLADPDLRQVMEELETAEDEALLAPFEVVAQDLPEEARRATGREPFTSGRKREELRRELQDGCSYTSCWPKDWLPQDCPNLRIIGVNYCSAVTEWSGGCEGRGALAERAGELRAALRDAAVGGAPLVWLAHSCGGLISQSVLADSSKSDSAEERRLATQTRALVLYSTPHRGSALATMPRATAALLWPSAIVRELQVDSPMLQQLNREFLAAAEQRGWETVSFGESRPTLVSPFKVPLHFVPPESADLGRGPFYELPLDHLSICKPASRHSLLYTSVVDILRRVAAEEPQHRHTGALAAAWRRWLARWNSEDRRDTEGREGGGARWRWAEGLRDAFAFRSGS